MTDLQSNTQTKQTLPPRLDNYLNLNTILMQGAALTLWMPVETVRLRLQCQSELMGQKYLEIRYKSWQNAISRIYATEGITAFWKGGLARIFSYGLSMPALSSLLNFFMKKTNYKIHVEKNKFTKEDFLIPASIVSASLMFSYPFEYARVRLANSNLKEYTPKPLKQFSGIIDVFSTTLQYEGISSLYRGFFLSFVETALWKFPLFILNMRLFQSMIDDKKPMVHEQSDHFTHMIGLACGFAIAYPANTVRKRMMMSNLSDHRYPGVKTCYRFIKKTEGLKGFYKGGSSYAALLGIYTLLPSMIKKEVPISVFV